MATFKTPTWPVFGLETKSSKMFMKQLNQSGGMAIVYTGKIKLEGFLARHEMNPEGQSFCADFLQTEPDKVMPKKDYLKSIQRAFPPLTALFVFSPLAEDLTKWVHDNSSEFIDCRKTFAGYGAGVDIAVLDQNGKLFHMNKSPVPVRHSEDTSVQLFEIMLGYRSEAVEETLFGKETKIEVKGECFKGIYLSHAAFPGRKVFHMYLLSDNEQDPLGIDTVKRVLETKGLALIGICMFLPDSKMLPSPVTDLDQWISSSSPATVREWRDNVLPKDCQNWLQDGPLPQAFLSFIILPIRVIEGKKIGLHTTGDVLFSV